MLCIYNPGTDPYFNLAAEEYFLDGCQEDVFMLWRNEPAIIVGKFQNSLAEINLDYVKEKQIKVVRRQTGGGAVFHDLGNLNFTFIESNSNGNFRTFTEPILEVLHQLGVDARFEGRNDLTIDGMKISGNAQCVHHGRTLHHGTLLFAAEMTDLSQALKVNPLKFQDKAVKSVRKRVTNISEYLSDKKFTVLDLADCIMRHVQSTREHAITYQLTEADKQAINRLVKEKYSTWEWNFGQSPRYTFHKAAKTGAGMVEVYLYIEKAEIQEVRIYGDFFSIKDIHELEKLLTGLPHNMDSLSAVINTIELEDYIRNITAEEFLPLFF
jgi:lipoate-protein ligase A